jgi:hypothetical protein
MKPLTIEELFDNDALHWSSAHEASTKQYSSEGTPMFSAHEVATAPNFLDRFLRAFFVANGITRETFSELYREYGRNILGLDNMVINGTKGNYIRALKRGRICPALFQRIMRVLGFSFDNTAITFVPVGGVANTLGVANIPKVVYDLSTLENTVKTTSNSLI